MKATPLALGSSASLRLGQEAQRPIARARVDSTRLGPDGTGGGRAGEVLAQLGVLGGCSFLVGERCSHELESVFRLVLGSFTELEAGADLWTGQVITLEPW